MRGWIAARASLITTVTSVGVIAALIAAVAIVSSGYTAQKLELGDASVWVSNGSSQVIGRANTEIRQLNSVVAGSSTELGVVQGGRTVLLIDSANARVDIVDPANSDVVESAALPAEESQIFLAGDNVVVHERRTGEVWVLAGSELSNFDSEAEATLSLGDDTAVTVTQGGTLYAFSASTGRLIEFDASAGGAAPTTREIEFGLDGDVEPEISLTVVGERVALLDAANRILWLDGVVVDLSEAIGPADAPVLQQPGPASEAVLVATESGLLSVPFDGSQPDELVVGRTAPPASPVVVGGCSFAAWSDGLAWRGCGDGEQQLTLSGMSSTALVFRVNGDRVLLNEAATGASWAVQHEGELINNWDELIEVVLDDEEVQDNDAKNPTAVEKTQMSPVAVDDSFGARPGRATILPVLLNDYDPNGDVLAISEVEQLDMTVGRVEIVRDRQQLQLTLEAGASGVVTFGYTITDGRGGSDSAVVTVTVRAPGENSPPQQMRETRATVGQGGRVTQSVLGDWVDPDGDAIYLTSAVTASPDSVSYNPEGAVVFQEGGGTATLRAVTLVVSDGSLSATGSLSVTVSPADDVPLVAEPFLVRSYASVEVRVSPLEHVKGGSGTVRLTSVPSRTGATIIANYDRGTFRFVSEQTRTFYIDYVVTDGRQTVTGQVRIDVEAPPNANSKPITIPKTIFVKTLSSEIINVAAMDTDPAGGVLLVTGVSGLSPASGVRADVLDRRAIRVSLIAPLGSEPVTFSYTITNGLASSVGEITVIEIPRPDRLQAPIAVDDTVTVRVGDTIDIPVLANDSHPDAEDLTLNPVLVEGLSGDSGLLFASGNRLRYLASQQTGNYTAVYEIAGPDGQTAQAQVRIAVREVVEASNNPPSPVAVTARVVAGEKVSVRIPLTGIDPDGDSVQLLGLESNPEKGAVTNVGVDVIEYQASEYSAGTDRFTYTVIDSLGARATGIVRIGIMPPIDGTENPVATADEVRMRPGGSVSVQVLANDSDPEGSALTVVSVEPNGPDISAEISGELVIVTPPSEPGRYGLVYTIQNEFGGTSSNFITVIVDPEAALAYPVASDTVLALSDILDRDTVTIDVLQNVFFADGPVSSLRVSVLEGWGAATVTADKTIRVTVADRSQIIPFAVSRPDDPSITAYAFIRVPGYNDALPQLDRTAGRLEVESEKQLVIDINDYVVAVGDRSVRLTDTTTVQATNSNGDKLVVDSDTLVFTSADKYFGPASISFEVTDGASADAEGARTATIVLPITVTPRENQPPVFTGGTIDFEPAEEKVLDLQKLTTYNYPDDLDELAYRVIEPLPAGFSYTLTGSTLTLRANADAIKGSLTSMTLGVRDDLNEGRAGVLRLGIVASTRPLASPAADRAVTPRGKTTTIDVLANDAATNPFPGRPLKVVDIRGMDGGTLPDGVTVSASADRSRLTVTVSDTAAASDIQLQYQVADATGDPDRYVWGTVTLSIQDVPDTPVAPARAGGHVDGALTLRITPPAANNSPISSYIVVGSRDYRKDCGTSQLCTLDDLQVGSNYVFRVIAVNALGESAAGAPSSVMRVDYLPAAPGSVTASPSTATPGELVISWAAVANPPQGTPIVGYTVRITGPGVGVTDIAVPSGTSLTTTAGGLIQPGQQYSVSVAARNSAQVTVDEWNRHSPVAVTAVGAPAAAGSLSATVVDASGGIRVTWTTGSWNGTSGGTQQLARFDEGATLPVSCTHGGPRPGTPIAGGSGTVDTTAVDGNSYSYVVYTDNGYFCSLAISGDIESKKAPGQAGFSLAIEHQSGGNFDLKVSGLTASGLPSRFEYMLGGDGTWRPVANGQFVTSSANSSVYGTDVDVQVRACRDASNDFCGPASAVATAMPVATRASILSCTPGEPITPQAPANDPASGLTVSYSIQYLVAGLPLGWNAWSPGGTVPLLASAVRVKASVGDGAITYGDPEYGETAC